jgi:hypothetical protein
MSDKLFNLGPIVPPPSRRSGSPNLPESLPPVIYPPSAQESADRFGLPQPIIVPPEIPDVVRDLLYKKHTEYNRLSRRYEFLYYATRTVAGLCASLLPFVVNAHPQFATALSIAIAVLIVVDSVFKPQDKWKLYSKAADLLTVAELKALGKYAEFKEMIDVMVNTEAGSVEGLVDLSAVLQRVKAAN